MLTTRSSRSVTLNHFRLPPFVSLTRLGYVPRALGRKRVKHLTYAENKSRVARARVRSTTREAEKIRAMSATQ